MMYEEKLVMVVKSQDGRVLREDKDTVLIPFGQEYTLQFKNLNTRKAVVSVEVDGEDVMRGRQLIIDAGQTVGLERFVDGMDSGHRFRFIQKTGEIQEHRGDRIDDGFIRIKFRFEKPIPQLTYDLYSPWVWKGGVNDFNQPYTSYNYPSGTSNVLRGGDGASSSTVQSLSYGNATMDSLTSPLVDEGITVKGSNSDQRFKYGNVGVLESEEHVMVLKMRGVNASGESIETPLTVNDKLTCGTCGRKWPSNHKYCGNCGTALI